MLKHFVHTSKTAPEIFVTKDRSADDARRELFVLKNNGPAKKDPGQSMK